ncbi:hypothetical protein [Colwellia sp. BRX9-1]|uniref:hypothetical protein n=1 Tax=Colwellia sp. BRX9-1 TaxID=2759830 RepID=UPI0015F59EC1|nr:hypothetical protein [Colwellia sp. BRX9-1]MBA6353597.1 hypothetical protein [Colwellia sp. BRX9-1]
MNFITILSKTSTVSIIASFVAYMSYFYLAANAMNNDFGNFTYYQSLMLLFINIIPFGSTMAVVIFRYNLSEYDYFQLIKEKLFILMPIILISISVITMIFSSFKVIDLDYHMLFSLLMLCYFNSISLVVMGYYRVSQRFLKYGGYFLVYTLINSLLLVCSYFYFGNLNTAFYTTTLSSGFFAIICLHAIKRDFNLDWRVTYIKEKLILSLNYGYPVVLSSLTMSFLVVGDKLILGSIAPSLLPSYAVAALISSTTLFLVNNFASAWAAFLVKKCNKRNDMLLFYYRKSRFKIMLVFPIGLLVLFAQYILYSLFYVSEYPGLFVTIITLTSAYFIFGISKFFMGYMNYLKKNMAVFYSSVLGVFGIILVIITGKIEFMALSILIGMLIQLLFCVVYTNKLLRSL